jgi:hypothetical protein
MIKPEQIPEEVEAAMAYAYLEAASQNRRPDECWRIAIAAGINAWPGVFDGHTWPDLVPTLVLPLKDHRT